MESSRVRVLDVQSGDTRSTLLGEWQGGLAVSPDGTLLTGVDAGSGATADASAEALLRTLPIEEGSTVFASALAPDGSAVACAIDDEVRVYCARTGELRARFSAGNALFALSLSFSPDGHALAAAMWCDSNTAWLCVWDLRTGLCLPALAGAPPEVTALEFSADGGVLVANVEPSRWVRCGEDADLQTWDVRAGALCNGLSSVEVQLARRLPSRSYSIREAALLPPDGAMLVFVTMEGNLHLQGVPAGAPHADLPSPEAGRVCRGFVLSPDGRHLATIPGASHGRPCTIHIWDLAARACCAILPCTGVISALSFSPDGRTLAFATGDAVIHLVEVSSGRRLARLFANEHGWIACAEGSPYFTGGWDLCRVLYIESGGQPLPPAEWARFDRPDQVRAALAGEALDPPVDGGPAAEKASPTPGVRR